jgi:pyruvate carboxylase subunit B
VKYTVTAGGREHVVEIDGPRVTLDGVALDVVVHASGGPVRRITLGDRSTEVVAVRGEEAGAWVVSAEGSRLTALVVDERSRAIRALAGAAPGHQGPAVVRAPMPGLVVRLLVAAGDRVAGGAGLVVVEAMKMENELKAPAAGVVARVHVSPGARVEKGAALVELAAS